MPIEEIRRILVEDSGLSGEKIDRIIDSIVQIRSAAYDQGWNDAEQDIRINGD